MIVQSAAKNFGQHPVAGLNPRLDHNSGQKPEALHAAGSVIHIAEGSEIFAEGENSDFIYKLLSGVARVCKFLSDGRRQIEAFHIPGEVFGLEQGSEHKLCAEAVTDCTLISIRRRNIEMLAQRDQSVGRELLQYAMQNLARAQKHSLLLGRRGAAEKVACFLLDLSEHSVENNVVKLEMTRQDIADYLGLTIETVSRSFSQFERDGIIALPNTREIRLRNMDTLEHLAA